MLKEKKESKEHLLKKMFSLSRQVDRYKAHELELLKIKEELKKSEEKYRMAFEYTGTAMMVIDEDTTVLMGNHKLEEVTGYPQEEAQKGRKWTEFVEEKDMPRLMEYHCKRREDPSSVPSEYEFRLKHRYGELKDILMNVSMIPGTRKSLISLIDITQRKKALEKLEESERRFREIAEYMPGIICEMDLDLNLTYVNKKGLETFGFTQDDFLSGINAKQVIHPSEFEKLKIDLENIFMGNFGNLQDYRMLRKNGEVIYTLINTNPILKGEKIVGLRSCLADITEQKMAREEQRKSEERFKSIFFQSPIGIAFFHHDGSIFETNNSFREMFDIKNGVKETEVTCNLTGCAGISKNILNDLLTGKSAHCESAFDVLASKSVDLKPEESHREYVRHLDWHLTPLKTNQHETPVILAQVQDITERKRAEEQEIKKAHDAAERARQLAEGLRKEIIQLSSYHRNMVSRSRTMKDIFDLLPQMADSDAAILITGESGTGKELIARFLHEHGPRKSKPFIAINCSALPDTLLESELFGYRAGAFTDAKKDKPGKFMQAEGGILFLDEIGDISPAMQVKLLRVLQEKTFEPLGDTKSVRADVRIISATNKDIGAMIRASEFREDLYYRIKILNIKLPPLRERRCDIPLLCDHFIGLFNTRYKKSVKSVSEETLDLLMSHDFPGNVRELENIIEHAFIFCKEDTIEICHLPSEIRGGDGAQELAHDFSGIKTFEDLEKIFIRNILAQNGGNKTKTAKKLGIHKATLFRKLKQLQVE